MHTRRAKHEHKKLFITMPLAIALIAGAFPCAQAQTARPQALAAGDGFSMALIDGAVWVWGSNGGGQLGRGDVADTETPLRVEGLSGVTQLAAYGQCALALKGDGSVWAWGANERLQLDVKLSPAKATGVPLRFSSNNERAVRVDEAGRLFALRKGTAKITIRAGERKHSFSVRVRQELDF